MVPRAVEIREAVRLILELDLRTTNGTGVRLLGSLRSPELEPQFLKVVWHCALFVPIFPSDIVLTTSTYDGAPSFFNRSWRVFGRVPLRTVLGVFGAPNVAFLYLSGLIEGVLALLSIIAVLIGALWLAQVLAGGN